ncbi:hypothetical protein [Streptomyces griseosporeus]|uniref:hypothetical protein n=1 Tax=Streptomyces griseosporeus TaxID=1910 RepID=UPI003702AB21
MTSEALAAPDDIHACPVKQLNFASRRPGPYGREPEQALRMLMDRLVVVKRQLEALVEQQHVRIEHLGCSSTGGVGVLRELVPSRYDEYRVASVYAEFAHCHGCLRPDRVREP